MFKKSTFARRPGRRWLARRPGRDGNRRGPGERPAGVGRDWATESIVAARQAYQDSATSQRIKPGAKLGDAYQERNPPLAKRRLLEAGVRLARVLNQAL